MASAKVTRGTAVRRKPAMTTKKLASRPSYQAPPPLAPATPPAVAPQNPAPVAPTQAVLPPDAGYEETMAGLAKARDSTITNLGAQRAQGMLDYGYQDSPGGGLNFDATNPFSQAAMLKRNFDQAHTYNTNSYAARGQLYSGALQSAQDETGHQELQRNDALQKSLLAFLASNKQQQAQAGIDYELGAGQAKGDAIARAPTNPAYTPVTDAPPAAGAPPSSAAAQQATKAAYQTIPWKDSKNRPGVLHIYKDGRRVFVRS